MASDAIAECDRQLLKEYPDKGSKQIYLANRGLNALSSFTSYGSVEALWVNSNRLQAITGIDHNPTLQALYAHNNRIYTLGGSLQSLKYLRVLSLYGNNLRDLQATLPYIQHLQNLESLDLFDNPLANETNYRYQVIFKFPNLHVLDRHEVTDTEREKAQKLYGKRKVQLVAFGKRVPRWKPGPKQAIASLSETTKDIYKEIKHVKRRRENEAQEAERRALLAEQSAMLGKKDGAGSSSSHSKQRKQFKYVARDYIKCSHFSNEAVEFNRRQQVQGQGEQTNGEKNGVGEASTGTGLNGSASFSLPPINPGGSITLDQAKYVTYEKWKQAESKTLLSQSMARL